MGGVKKLKKIQWVKEVTAGTAVSTATAIWRGMGSLDDQREVVEVEEDVGMLGGTDRTHIPKEFGVLELEETPATFEQLQYLFAMGLGGPNTGTVDGAGSDYIYTTTVPTTAQPTRRSYTVQAGDNFEVEQMEYTLCNKLSLKATGGEAVMVSGTLFGRQVERIASFTSITPLPTVETILSSKGKVYLDAIGGTAGTTQVSNTILAMELEIEPIWEPKYGLDGALYFSFAEYVDQKITGKLTFEHTTAVSGNAGEKANWRAETPKLLHIKFEGSAVASAGTAYSVKTFIISLPIKWKKFNPIEDQNGNNIIVGEFTSRYNITAATAGSFIVVNELTSLT
jgi:hypothetical protein